MAAGELKLLTRKVPRRDAPPDIKAVKMLLDGEADIGGMSDEELEERRKKLLAMLENNAEKKD